jgi:hypothetical protein
MHDYVYIFHKVDINRRNTPYIVDLSKHLCRKLLFQYKAKLFLYFLECPFYLQNNST